MVDYWCCMMSMMMNLMVLFMNCMMSTMISNTMTYMMSWSRYSYMMMIYRNRSGTCMRNVMWRSSSKWWKQWKI